MRKDRWVILAVIIFISSVLIFVLNDRTKEPEILHASELSKKDINKTEQQRNKEGLWKIGMDGNEVTYAKCDEDYPYNQTRGACYKENPLGHTMVTFLQLIAIVLTIGLITIYEFKDWRIYLSNKILPYRNKYVDELRAIPRSPELHVKKGVLWVWGGFDALVSGRDNNVYVSLQEHTAMIQHNVTLKGGLQKVKAQQLYKYLNHDLPLLREILDNPILKTDKKGRLLEVNSNIAIWLTLPGDNAEKEACASVKGGFGFGADRFTLVLEVLYRMRKGLIGYGAKLQKAQDGMLQNSRVMCETTANIADAVSQTQKSEIEHTTAQQPQPDQSYDQRKSM